LDSGQTVYAPALLKRPFRQKAGTLTLGKTRSRSQEIFWIMAAWRNSQLDWRQPSRGGRVTILESNPADFIRIELDSLSRHCCDHTAEFRFQPQGDATSHIDVGARKSAISYARMGNFNEALQVPRFQYNQCARRRERPAIDALLCKPIDAIASCSPGKSFTVDGLREKLREFFREEVIDKCARWPLSNVDSLPHCFPVTVTLSQLLNQIRNLRQKVDLRWSRELHPEETEQEARW
jgi:hypothetical protein